jgi:hypothetical protein
MNPLVLTSDFNESLEDILIKVLATLCRHLQEEYDISPHILNRLFNQPDFITNCRFLHEQYLGEMTLNLKTFKSSHRAHGDHIQSEETEKCGHLVASHYNGYVSYCNVHRYLHPHPDLKCKHEPDEIDHPFVMKTPGQIVKERYYMTIHLIYQSFVNKLYHMMRLLLLEMLLKSCQQSVVPISEIKNLIDKMQRDPDVFKSRTIYELPKDDSGKSASPLSQGGVCSPSQYYLKVFRWSPQT